MPRPDSRLLSISVLAVLALAFSLALAHVAASAQSGPVYKTLVNPDFRHLLVIHSHDQSSASAVGLQRGIDLVLAQSETNVLVRSEYMDVRRNTGERYAQLFEELLRIKYKGAHFDGIITSGLPALRLAARLRTEIFPDTVVMAAGVDTSGTLPTNLEGIHIISENLHHGETLLLALRQNTDAKRITIVNVPAPGAPARSASLNKVSTSLAKDYEVQILENMAPPEIEQRLADTRKSDIVYISDYMRTGETGLDMSYEDVRRMAYSSSAPVYASREFFMGTGVVGGIVSSWREQGRRAMWMTLDLWAGRYVRKQFDDVGRANRAILDYGPLTRFGLSADAATAPTIIHAPRKKFDDFRKYFDIYVVGGVFAVLILLMLLVHLRRQAALKRRLARPHSATKRK